MSSHGSEHTVVFGELIPHFVLTSISKFRPCSLFINLPILALLTISDVSSLAAVTVSVYMPHEMPAEAHESDT